jgi:hypothetical protein
MGEKMKYTYCIKMRAVLWAMLGIACFAFAPPVAFGGWVGETMCACPGMSKPLGNNATCEDACYGTRSSTGGGNSTPGYDYGAAERAREAEAERQRQQAEADRIERERQAEIKRQKDAAFIRDRDAAANTLKGSTGPAMNQLKGLSGTDNLGLKGSGFDTGSTGLKELRGSSQPASHTDTSVVDSRGVPSGLQKALDNAIASAYSSAPPGVSDRVRKGFQAVMERDWKVAKAWFQDALKLDSTNAGLKRLVALADTSQQPNKQSATVDERNEPAGLGGKSDMKGSSAPPNKTKPALTTGTQLQLPDPNDIYILFPGLEATTDPNLQLPNPDDIYFLFPGLKAIEDKEALDYLFGLDPYPPAPKSGKAK